MAVAARIVTGLKFVERDPTLLKLLSTLYSLAYNLASCSNVVLFSFNIIQYSVWRQVQSLLQNDSST